MFNENGLSTKTLLTDHQLVANQPRISGWLAADRTKTFQFWPAQDQAL